MWVAKDDLNNIGKKKIFTFNLYEYEGFLRP